MESFNHFIVLVLTFIYSILKELNGYIRAHLRQRLRLRLRPHFSSPAAAISSSTPGLLRVLDVRRGTA